jgi:2-amino-4-hydroxy-6-hydroxymethyldihydropteridine diphosphokinase
MRPGRKRRSSLKIPYYLKIKKPKVQIAGNKLADKFEFMNQVFLLLGSNLGDARANIFKAKQAIEGLEQNISAYSSLYVTQAWGKEDQPDFLNQVVEISYEGEAKNLLNKLLAIETSLGRTRHQKWDARVIDIDILFFGNQIINEPDLKIPHPQIPNRRFTLIPLKEIAANFIHPVFHKTISQLLNECTDPLSVRKL